MRKFYLENSIGERKPLNGETGIYFQNPAGLGMVLNPSFADNKRGFFVKTSGDIEPQGEIVGDLVFVRNGDPYENYRNANVAELQNFINGSPGEVTPEVQL